jgi:hypothetical protein
MFILNYFFSFPVRYSKSNIYSSCLSQNDYQEKERMGNNWSAKRVSLAIGNRFYNFLYHDK